MGLVKPIPSTRNFQDWTAKRSGHLFVVGCAGKEIGGYFWHCICSCGRSCVVSSVALRAKQKSCGCKHGKTLKEMLLSKRVINRKTGCWEWIGNKVGFGYGSFQYRNKQTLAHRASYSTFVGEIPNGLHVCHKCNNPRCINPEHLYAGTYLDNINDMVSAKRHKFGETHSLAKVSDDDVRYIRRMYAAGYGSKQLGRIFGIHKDSVLNIVKRKTWSHVI